MKKPTVHVTDHAVIRYLERVLGYDVETLRREIGQQVDRGVQLGATGVIIDGHCYKIDGHTVITILRRNTPDIRTGR